jgi:hypothetical protein
MAPYVRIETTTLAALACSIATAIVAAPSVNSQSADRIASNSVAQTAFELRDGQSGFAGVTGTIWRIAADGVVTISRFVNSGEVDASIAGKISTADLAKLRKQFAENRFETLPASMGVAPAVNQRTLTLTRGGKTVVLSLPAVNPERPFPVAKNSDEQRLINLALTIRGAAERAAHESALKKSADPANR